MAEEKQIRVGGQAVIEGVMMRSPEFVATAVRKPDGRIALKEGVPKSGAASRVRVDAVLVPRNPNLGALQIALLRDYGLSGRFQNPSSTILDGTLPLR